MLKSTKVRLYSAIEQKTVSVLIGLLVCLVPVPALVADSGAMGHWFYMVKTRSTNPAREAEFNA